MTHVSIMSKVLMTQTEMKCAVLLFTNSMRSLRWLLLWYAAKPALWLKICQHEIDPVQIYRER